MNRKRAPLPGSRPGTLVTADSASPTRVRVIRYGPDHLDVTEDVEVASADLRAAEEGVLWVEVSGLSEEAVLRDVAEPFGIHLLALEDVVNVPVRAKAENYDDHVLWICHLCALKDDEAVSGQVSILFGPGWLLSFREGRIPDPFAPIVKRLANTSGTLRRSDSDYLAYTLLDVVVDAALPVAEALAEQLEEIEDRLLDGVSPGMLRELHDVKQELTALRRMVSPHREAVQEILRDEDERVSDGVRLFLRDVHDHAVHVVESIDASREMVSNLLNLYVSLQAQRTNDVMRVLTIVASIFVPLTFIAGVYGMNFDDLPGLHRPWGFPLLVVAMVVVAVGMVVYFARKGWLRADD